MRDALARAGHHGACVSWRRSFFTELLTLCAVIYFQRVLAWASHRGACLCGAVVLVLVLWCCGAVVLWCLPMWSCGAGAVVLRC